MARGRVLRFDAVRGYGFIEPDDGGEDLFLHVNDLLDDKHLIRSGTIVEFDVQTGERGLKAGGVQITAQPADRARPPPVAAQRSPAPAAGREDGLTRAEFDREVTELLLQVDQGSLTGAQLVAVRQRLADWATRNRWLQDLP